MYLTLRTSGTAQPRRAFLILGLLAVLFAVAGASVAARVARADGLPPAGTFGYDISYPQCPSKVPQGPFAFAIIGVNGGKPMTQNSCMPAQLAWASKGAFPPGVYVNSSSPPASFSTSVCLSGDRNCRAFEFGRQSAQYSLNYVAQHHSQITDYWLDVETANTWSQDTDENAAVLRGMIATLTGAGKFVGIYSNNSQFTRIAGSFAPGLDNWIPRPEARRDNAATYCRTTPSFGGGRIVMIQLWYEFDENYVCPEPGAASTPPPSNLRAGDSAVVAADGTCVNLRSGGGLTFPILECVNEGTKVSVTGTPVPSGQYTWVPIAVPSGKKGWAASDYLRPAPVTPPGSPTPTATPTPAMRRIVIVNVAGD